MKIRPEKIKELIQEVEQVIDVVITAEKEFLHLNKSVHPANQKGVKNLIHYRALRSMDLSQLQKRLSNLGLSILGSSESHVLYSLITINQILHSLIKEEFNFFSRQGPSIKASKKIQKKHAKNLLGYRSKSRRVRIMVTLPTAAAFNYEMVYDLLASGMNTARINCAHDNPAIWKKMIRNLELAKVETGKNCKLFMDLAGPKIRTGSLVPGPRIRKFTPQRNRNGEVVNPAIVTLVSELNPNSKNQIPVNIEWRKTLEVGDSIEFKDARNKKRTLFIKSVFNDHVIATSQKTCYINEGTEFTCLSTLKTCHVGALPAVIEPIILFKGDHIRLIKKQVPGKSAVVNNNGEVAECAFISISMNEVFDAVSKKERCIFNDGKIEGIVVEVSSNELLVEITKAKINGSKLSAYKGVNFPDTSFSYTSLTSKDKEDLVFVLAHADAVNVSFIHSAADLKNLFNELERIAPDSSLGIIIKIETQLAFDNLVEILLYGMQKYPLGIMIARGDLAIETGWEHMAQIQQEIIRYCNSAYIPTIWATQVLENLAKKGIPSRSELTDVATSVRADCVMLNKGPYIKNAVALLNEILSQMDQYRDKNERLFQPVKQVN